MTIRTVDYSANRRITKLFHWTGGDWADKYASANIHTSDCPIRIPLGQSYSQCSRRRKKDPEFEGLQG